MQDLRTGQQPVEIGPGGVLRLPPECVEAVYLQEGDTWNAIWIWGRESVFLAHQQAACCICGKKQDIQRSDLVSVGLSTLCKNCI